MTCEHTREQKHDACDEYCPICLSDTRLMEQLQWSIERAKLLKEIKELRAAVGNQQLQQSQGKDCANDSDADHK